MLTRRKLLAAVAAASLTEFTLVADPNEQSSGSSDHGDCPGNSGNGVDKHRDCPNNNGNGVDKANPPACKANNGNDTVPPNPPCGKNDVE